MTVSITEMLSARKKQIILAMIILAAFYIISAWNVGKIISFIAFYGYGFDLLTKNLGVNEWLARAILIPTLALLVISLSKMLSVTSRKARQIGTTMTVAILSLFCLTTYFQTKDRLLSQLFDAGGKANFRYYVSDGRMDLFPANTTSHPSLGQELAPLSPQVLEKFKKEGREQTEKQFLARRDVWAGTGYYTLRGDEIEITEPGFPGTDLMIKIGDNGPTKYLMFNSGNSRKRKIIAESDGVLFLKIGENNANMKEISITGLSIRLYQ